MSKKILIAFVAMALVTVIAVASAVMIVSFNISNTVTVQTNGNVALYSDSACTVPLGNSIAWSTLSASGHSDKDIYVKETAGQNVWIVISLTGLSDYGGGNNYYSDTGGGLHDVGHPCNIAVEFAQATMLINTAYALNANSVLDIPVRLMVGDYAVNGAYGFGLTISAYNNAGGT